MVRSRTLETYDKYAAIYDQEVVEFWGKFPRDFLARFAENTNGGRILNVGSGSGRDAILLRERGLDVVCVDGSKSMVAMTTTLGFESHLTDFSEIDFPLGSFDGAWAYTSLIHIPKEQARMIIKKLHSILKSDGIFMIGVMKGETAGMVERESMPGVKRYFKNYSGDELREMIEPLGFTLLHEQDYQPRRSVYINHLYKKIVE